MNSLLYVHQLSSKLSGRLLIAGWVKKQTVTWVAWGLAEGRWQQLSSLLPNLHFTCLFLFTWGFIYSTFSCAEKKRFDLYLAWSPWLTTAEGSGQHLGRGFGQWELSSTGSDYPHHLRNKGRSPACPATELLTIFRCKWARARQLSVSLDLPWLWLVFTISEGNSSPRPVRWAGVPLGVPDLRK